MNIRMIQETIPQKPALIQKWTLFLVHKLNKASFTKSVQMVSVR